MASSSTTVSRSSRVPAQNAEPVPPFADLKKLEMLARAAAYHEHGQPIHQTKPKRKPAGSARAKITKVFDLEDTNENPWVEKYFPKSLNEHFVHKNKVLQFRNWLNNKRGSKMCLLTGGSGVGKTATVYLVAAELGFQVKEWLNPMSLNQYQTEEGWKNGEDEIRGRSLVSEFVDFLLRSSQYSSLPIKGRSGPKKSLVLVEDFPNFFYTDVPLVHQLIRNYKALGGCPLVFIMTDTTGSDFGAYKLFPAQLLTELDIQEIALNSVAPSFMAKFANFVLAQANVEVSSGVVTEIVTASAGDMRSAINTLQFRLQGSKSTSNSRPANKKRKVAQSHNLISLSPKDDTLFLFHAIGKVLYAKRDLTDVLEIEIRQITGSLINERRIHPLKEVPERIGDRIGVSPETFFNFLAENYLSFFTSLNDAVRASTFLAESSSIFSSRILDDMVGTTRNFKNWQAREEFGLSVAIRGLMFSNQKQTPSTWKPLCKPKFNTIHVEANAMIQNTHAFCAGPITQDYFTDLVPFAALIRPKTFTREKRDFLREYGRFLVTREVVNELNEMDDVGPCDDIEPISMPPNGIQGQTIIDRGAPAEEDEFVIEDVPD